MHAIPESFCLITDNRTFMAGCWRQKEKKVSIISIITPLKFIVKLWDWMAYSERTRWRRPFCQKSAFKCKLAGRYKDLYALLTPDKSLRKWLGLNRLRSRPCLEQFFSESLVHNNAWISPTICTNSLIFSKWTFFILIFQDKPTYPIVSQI